MKIKLTISIFIFLTLTKLSLAQQDKININKVIENIKLNIDRDIYFNGEKIYFSADYFINNKKQTPVLSKIIYLELINCTDKTSIVKQKHKIKDFKAIGIINIPKNIESGNYILRAYTQYQRNFSEYNFSYQFITILNPKSSSKPILNSLKNKQDSIFSNLLKVKKSTIQTKIKYSKNNVLYEIHTKGFSPENQNFEHELCVYTIDYRLKHTETINLKKISKSINFPNTIFEEGINYIVIKNSKGNILKINSLFKNTKKIEKIEINTDKDNFKTREKIEISLYTEKTNNFPNASIFVVTDGTRKEDYNFKASLYLKNSLLLTNFLENKPYYNNNKISQIMNLFDANINKNKFAENIKSAKNDSLNFIPEINDLSINGILRNKKTKEPISGRDVFVSVLFNNSQIHVCKTKENGSFILGLNNVFETNDIFLCSETYFKDEKEHEILIHNPFSNKIPEIGTVPTFFYPTDKKNIEKLYINSQISQNFEPKNNSNTHLRIKPKKFNIDNSYKTTTAPSDYVELKNIEEFLFEVVKNVKVRKKKNQYSLFVSDGKGNILPGNPLILVDRVPVFDSNKIMKIKLEDIDKIDVIYKSYVFGSHIFQGVIMFTTNTDNFAGIKFPQSSTFLEYLALKSSPEYFKKNKKQINNIENKPDFRTTLYQNLNIKISNRKKTFTFKASDRKGIYNIIVKGYNSNGEVFFGKKQITIN